jgi:hypothetical protein
MRPRLILSLLSPVLAFGQDFTGVWILQEAESQLNSLPARPAARLTIQREGGKFTCRECGVGGWVFTTDRKSTETRAAEVRNSVAAKWEGDDLMINAMIMPTRGQQYVLMDHWHLSRGGARLTIQRECQQGASTVESTIVYQREGAAALTPDVAPAPVRPVAPVEVAPTPPPPSPPTSPTPAQPAKEHVLEAGARLPLRSISTFSSKTAHEGERVYLETLQPISRFGRMLLPAGTQITATIAFAKQAGKVKGRGEMLLRFESLTTPDGVTKDFRAQVSGADATAGQVDSEGRIRSGGNKGGDAGTVGTTTATGAIIGASAAGKAGLGVGAAAGAAAGLARVLSSRGPEVNIRRGDVVEMALDREIRFDDKEVH